MSTIKKNIIILCTTFIIGIIIGFGLSEYKSRTILGQSSRDAAVLQERVQQLESELERYITELEFANSKLNSAESRVDECLGITRQLRGELEQCYAALGGSNPIIQELRKRIAGYEARATECENIIKQLQASLVKQ